MVDQNIVHTFVKKKIMIDARELRLGNLINFPFIDANVEVLGLALKDDYKLFIQSNLNNNTFFETPEKYQPIPLTEQWLLDFGFEKLNDIYKFYNWFWIDTECSGVKGYYFRSIDGFKAEIKHVHQLQNLFYALTGQELELNKK